MKKFLYLAGFLIVIIIYFIFKFYSFNSPKTENGISRGNSPGSRFIASVPVTAVVARTGNLTQFINTGGTITALQHLEITATVSGTIQSIAVHNGEPVAANKLLIVFDEQPFLLELQHYRSAFFKALGESVQELEVKNTPNAALLRNFFLRAFTEETIAPLPSFRNPKYKPAPGAIPADSVTLTRAEYLTLARYQVPGFYVNVKQAEYTLGRCRLRALFAGVISGILVSEGGYIREGTKLLTLTNLNRLQVVIDVLEEDLPFIHRGSRFTIKNSREKEVYNGTISGVSPEIDSETRTGKAYASIKNSHIRFPDGQFVQVRLEKQTYKNRLVVPREAVLVRNDRELVFVVQKNRAQWRYIKKGRENDRFTEILSGVQPGDTVIVGGHYSLAHDARVEVELNKQ